MKRSHNIQPGDTVCFAAVPHGLKYLQHCRGTVLEIRIGPGGDFAFCRFDDKSATGKEVVIATVHLAKVAPANGGKTRRPPLYLHDPTPDPRDEAERLSDTARLLEAWGYTVLRVGQGRAAAICHKCTREQKRMVQIHCRDCGSKGFAPSTNSTEGVPDTFIGRDDWPTADWLGIEWKDAPNGTRQPAQKQLEARGRILVAWNEISCLVPVAAHEQRLGVEPSADLIAYLTARDLWPLPTAAAESLEQPSEKSL